MRLKKRYLVLAVIVLIIIFGSVIAVTKPVLPNIQLPGEVFPGTKGFWPQTLFNGTGITNTFLATLLTWLLVLILAFSLRARSRTADEVPTGFYNLFEMIIEGAYNFAQGEDQGLLPLLHELPPDYPGGELDGTGSRRR